MSMFREKYLIICFIKLLNHEDKITSNDDCITIERAYYEDNIELKLKF